jgi:glutathione S-transferase
MYRVYGDIQSGNCYKVKLMLHLLDVPHEWVPIDILRGETQTASFLEKNPNGKIPLLELADGQHLSESNAILSYLAEGTPFLPAERFQRAKVLQWLFFEQYSHEPYIAVARFIEKYLGLPAERVAEYEAKRAGGYRALRVMERELECSAFLCGERPTIADISLYAYTHVAHEGGFALKDLPAVRAWLSKLESRPRHVTMADAASLLGEPKS